MKHISIRCCHLLLFSVTGGGEVMTWDPGTCGDFQSCRGACWLAPGGSQNTVSRPSARPSSRVGWTNVRPLRESSWEISTVHKRSPRESTGGNNDHSYILWRRARWPGEACTSAAMSAPWLWAGALCPTGAWIGPRRALQGSSRNAPVFLSGHLPGTHVPEAESRDPAGEQPWPRAQL